MSDAWDGRPQNPGQSGMHLLRARLTGHLTGWYWNATTERFHHEHVTLGRAASIERYVYECPILTPAEVEARVAEARRESLADAAWAARNLWARGGLGCDIEIAILEMLEPGNE
jgi:hypothetical protein